jgi:hypothetical protein
LGKEKQKKRTGLTRRMVQLRKKPESGDLVAGD